MACKRCGKDSGQWIYCEECRYPEEGKKRCSKCRESKPKEEFYGKAKGDGYSSMCKVCSRKRSSKSKERRKGEIDFNTGLRILALSVLKQAKEDYHMWKGSCFKNAKRKNRFKMLLRFFDDIEYVSGYCGLAGISFTKYLEVVKE